VPFTRRTLPFLTLLGAFTITMALAEPAEAQQAPTLRDLPRPTREIEDPFSLVAGLRELSRNRVAVADGGDGEVALVDFATGERTPLGRQGAGPGEYRSPSAIFRGRADTLWVFDPPQQRMTVFLPDTKAGVPFRVEMFDAATRTAVMAPFHADETGRLYASALPVGAGGPRMQIPDSVEVIRFDPRAAGARAALTKVRFPTSGTPEMRVEGTVIKYTMAFPGLVTADSWAVFPDGRVAIVHGATYTVEFIGADGRRTTARPIPYDRIPVTRADHEAEMAEARRQLAEQLKAAQRSMPAGMTLDLNMTAPESWPETYPAISPLAIFAASDGMLWVRRATPSRQDREQWDVINPAGALVARWRLPTRTRLVGVGTGAAYTIRMDEDDLQYLQRIELPR
jgi:hypothetical protein